MKLHRYESVHALLFFVLLSIVLMAGHFYSENVRQIARALSVLSAPVHLIAASPSAVYRWFEGSLDSEDELELELAELSRKQLVLQTRLQQFKALESENERLRNLLHAGAQLASKIQLAQLVKVNLYGHSHSVLINRGAADGVIIGLPVIDEDGLVGQVTWVGSFRSAVALVTDPAQGVPVQSVRTGLRAIAFGVGGSGELRLLYVDRNADIRIGDLLVTSGLGGIYPSRYPVARVSKIKRHVDEAFMAVHAMPSARLNKGHQVVLVWHDSAESSAELDPALPVAADSADD
ncbi:MAG: rod shape-determining protein MreC [Gammaproteobacteria bacterium]|nr:rod shape-determining protein MreC [Gammaproteobacteria bacterium]